VARFGAPAALAFLLVVELATAPARAAMFDDDEARKRIETLRGRVDQIERALSQRLDALETKNAGVVDLFKDVEQIKAIVAETLHDLIDPLIYAEAATLIEEHHAALLGHENV